MTAETKAILVDTIYGGFSIDSSVILNLLNSASVQRLKGLNQFGIPDRYFDRENYSRYEHSVGVMLLLKRLGASEEEQIAGLLHDLSHRAFSHVYDWVVGSEASEDAQDNSHNSFVANTDVPEILATYGYDIDRIVDYHHFGILEKDIPDLCADRVDYALRQMELEIAKRVLEGLIVIDEQIVAKDFETAALFAREFLSLQINYWGGQEGVSRYYHFSNILKFALEQGIIAEKDFLGEDEEVMKKLEDSGNREVLERLEYLKQKSLPTGENGIVITHKKFRYIDPLFLEDGNLIRLSSVDQKFAVLLEEAKKFNEKGILVSNFNF